MAAGTAAALPLVAIEIQNFTMSPFQALTDAQFSYLAGSITALNPTIGGQVIGRMRSCTIQRGKQQALNRFEAGTVTAVLDNRDGALDPQNASSPFYPFIRPESRIRIRAWYNRVLLGQALCTDTAAIHLNNCTVASVTPGSPRLSGFSAYQLTASAAGSMFATVFASSDRSETPWDDTKGQPVTPGETVTAVASVRAAVTGRSCQLQVNFFTAAGSWLGSGVTLNGAVVSDGTSGWTDLSVTGVVPAGAAYAQVVVGILSPSSGEVHSVTCLGCWGGNDTNRLAANLVPGQPATLGGSGVMAIQLFYGYTDGWTNDWKVPNVDATVHLTATDAFKRFNSFDIRDYFTLTALTYSPIFYAQLDESAGAGLLTDIGGGSFLALNSSANGPTLGATPSAGSSGSLPVLSSSDRCVTFTGNALGNLGLVSVNGNTFTSLSLLSGSGPWTFACWVQCANTSMGTFCALFSQGLGGSGQALLEIAINNTGNSTGNLYAFYTDTGGTTHTANNLNGTTVICDGNWRLLVVTVDSSGNCTGYVNGVSTGSASLGVSPTESGGQFLLGARSSPTGYSDAFSGSVDQAMVFGSILSSSQISALYAARTSLQGQFCPTAANNLLSVVGWSLGFLQQFVAPYSIGPLSDIDRTTLLDALNNKIVVTDYSAFFIRPDGQACYFTGQYSATNTTVAATFSDVNDANYGWQNIPFDAIQRQEDEQLVLNDFLATWNGVFGSTPQPSQQIEISNSPSIATYGTQKSSLTLHTDSVGNATNLTQWLCSHFSQPQIRFPRLSVNLKAFPAAAPAALARELMDYVTLVQTPMGLSAQTYHPLIIHIEDQLTTSTWHRSFVLDQLDA